MRRREPAERFMTPRRWAVIVLLSLGLVLALILLYLQWARSDYAREEREAVQRAVAEAGLRKAESAVKFVWDEVVWVVRGEREDGSDAYVWVFADRVEITDAGEAYDADALRRDVLREHPDAAILRIRPGYAEGRRIWEVWYTRNENGVERHFYGFYAFEDGSPFRTYRLPAKATG